MCERCKSLKEIQTEEIDLMGKQGYFQIAKIPKTC